MKYLLLLSAASTLFIGCAVDQSPKHGIRGKTTISGGENIGTKAEDEVFSLGNAKVRATDYLGSSFDRNQQHDFLRMRCLTLGKALGLLDSKSAAKRQLGREEIGRVEAIDRKQTQRWRAANPKAPVQGLVIPRYIAKELGKNRAKQNRLWLARQGRLLQAAFELENFQIETWSKVRLKMMQEGDEGREFLAAQMIRRLTVASPKFVEFAQNTIANYVAKESIPSLVAVAHLDLPSSMGVFPKRVAETLGLIGPDAVPEILKVWHSAEGKFIPVTDTTFPTRRYLAKTLGFIGDQRALKVLANDLLLSEIKNDTSRFIYDQYVIESLGNFRDKKAVGPIKTVWARYFAMSDYALDRTAKDAIRKITGKTYVTPADVPLK